MKLSRTRIALGALTLFVIAALWLAGTLRSPGEVLPSADEFVSWRDCPAPCWRGIKPGKSRSNDVFRALVLDKAIQSAGIHLLAGEPEEGNTDNAYLISWIEPHNGQSSLVVMRNDSVELVQVSNYSQLTMGDIVQRFGPPEHLIVFGSDIGHYVWTFIGYWPSQGIVVFAHMPFSEKLTLDPSVTVTNLIYFEPTSEDRMWQIPYLVAYVNSRCTRANWLPWPGWVEVPTFGPYDCK